MIDEFRPLGLSDAARRVGVDPFELVRLAVVFDEPLARLRLGADAIARLRAQAGIEELWADRALPEDSNPVRAAVRGAAQLLLDRGWVGQSATRLDNLGRGLPPIQQDAIEEAATILAEEGVLLLVASPRGVQVSVAPGAEATLRAIAAGTSAPESLAALWVG